MTPLQYCQNKVLHAGSSLYYSVRFLPAQQREAITVLHALFHELNDIIYECRDKGVARTKFEWWQNQIYQTFNGTPHHPVTQALHHTLQRYHLAWHYFQELVEGLLWDLETTHYATSTQLEDYCKRTGSILSMLCTQVLGYQHDSTLKYAEQLGIALELTHLLRRLRRAVSKGRIYLPEEELKQFHVTEQNLFNCQQSDATKALFAHQVARIRGYYHSAFQHLAPEDYLHQRAGLIRAHIALATLQEIEKDGYQLFRHHICLTPVRKLWIMWRTQWHTRRGKM